MKKKKTLIASLAILGTLFITAGISYSLFSYSKNGKTENTIESGSIKFHYEEGNRSISLTDAMPMSDEQGKAQDKYFDFTITSETSSEIKVPYYITARRKGNDSSLDSSAKLYLTEVNNNAETALTLENNKEVSKFSELNFYSNTVLNIDETKNEKVLYIGEVPKNSSNYEKNYRLRMWLGENATYTQTETGTCSDTTYTTKEDCQGAGADWTVTATAEQKEFTITVNVYAEGESDVISSATVLKDSILANNTLITAVPTLTDSSNNTSDTSGLYKMSVTNGFGGTDGDTYYFRGNVDNNYVDFANKIWRIIRINEDGTLRLILDESTDESTYVFNSNYNDFIYSYYSNSSLKTEVESWYNANITETNASKVVTGNYFCEASKAKRTDNYTLGNATITLYNEYTPDLKCATDGNNKGLLNNSVGLINYDEVVLAGGYPAKVNRDSYLYKNYPWWGMSPAGFNGNVAAAWYMYTNSKLMDDKVSVTFRLRPVINLKSDVLATGSGTTSDPYVVQ